MNTVIFDPEDLEPITVIDVSRVFIKEIEEGRRSPYLRFGILEPLKPYFGESPMELNAPKIAEVRFEPFRYRGKSHWMAFALNPEICLLLRSVFLPGQSRAVNDERKTALAKGFFKGLQLAARLMED